jgi:hypothetical protein
MKFKVVLLLLLNTLAYSNFLKKSKTRQGEARIVKAALTHKIPPGAKDFYVFYDDESAGDDDICLYDLINKVTKIIKTNELASLPTYYKVTGTWEFQIKSKPKPEFEPLLKPEPKPEPEFEPLLKPEPEPEPEFEPLLKPEPEPEPEPEPLPKPESGSLPELLVVHCHFNEVASDFAYEALSLKYFIKALKYFQLPDSHIYIHLKTVYKSFVYIDVFHAHMIKSGIGIKMYEKRGLFSKLASNLKGQNLKSYSAKNIMIKDIPNLKKIKTIFDANLDVNLFLLMINFPVKKIEKVVTKTLSLGDNLLKHLKSVIIDNEHSIFVRFFANRLQTLKDFQFLQKIVRLESRQQKILLEYIAKSNNFLFSGVNKKGELAHYFQEIKKQFRFNRAFADLVIELLKMNPSSEVSSDTSDINLQKKTTKHLKVIESIFCHETLVHNFPVERFQNMKYLFFYSDWVEEILKVVFSKLNLADAKYKKVLEDIPDIQKTEISRILKSNRNEVEDLKTVINVLPASLTTEEFAEEFSFMYPPVSLNHAIALGKIYEIDEGDHFWKIIGDINIKLDSSMILNFGITGKIVNKKVNLPRVDNHLDFLLRRLRSEPFMSALPDPKNINNVGDILGNAGKGNENSNKRRYDEYKTDTLQAEGSNNKKSFTKII